MDYWDLSVQLGLLRGARGEHVPRHSRPPPWESCPGCKYGVLRTLSSLRQPRCQPWRLHMPLAQSISPSLSLIRNYLCHTVLHPLIEPAYNQASCCIRGSYTSTFPSADIDRLRSSFIEYPINRTLDTHTHTIASSHSRSSSFPSNHIAQTERVYTIAPTFLAFGRFETHL